MQWLSTYKSLYLYIIHPGFLRHLNQLPKLRIQENSERNLNFWFLLEIWMLRLHQAHIPAEQSSTIPEMWLNLLPCHCPQPCPPPMTCIMFVTLHCSFSLLVKKHFSISQLCQRQALDRLRMDHAFYTYPVSAIYHQCVILFDTPPSPVLTFFSFVPLGTIGLTNFYSYLYSYTLALITRLFSFL